VFRRFREFRLFRRSAVRRSNFTNTLVRLCFLYPRNDRFWFGESIRAGQQQVIEAHLSGKDVFFCSPTGSGKSLCFEIAPFVYDYVNLGISAVDSRVEFLSVQERQIVLDKQVSCSIEIPILINSGRDFVAHFRCSLRSHGVCPSVRRSGVVDLWQV